MTADEWRTETNKPKAMLAAVAAQASARKLRLFAVAVAKLVVPPDDTEARVVLRAAEQFAIGAVTDATLEQAFQRARTRELTDAAGGERSGRNPTRWISAAVAATTLRNASAAADRTFAMASMSGLYRHRRGRSLAAANFRAAVSDLCREFFGPLDHPLALAPAWLLANPADAGPAAAFRRSVTAAAKDLARAADSRNDFTVLPILADALEDGGCTDRVLLDHLRDTTLTHRRGCWAVDLVLAVQHGERIQTGEPGA